ncbi:MAG: ABC transporter permease [Pirellulales bacterium]
MRDSLYLAWQYLRHHRLTTAVLMASITLIIYLPAALQVIVANAEQHFRSRAIFTPLLIGPRGSELELVLSNIYFDKPYKEIMRFEQLRRIERQELGEAIPLHTKFAARDCQIVGTSKNYLRARKLRMAQGESWSILGECVVGTSVAGRLGLQVGDKIPVSSSPAFVLDSPPLRLSVAGVLTATETPDDEAIFVDLETVWILEGLGHGHAASAQHGSPEVQLFTDITTENAASYHFHGDRGKFPITAVMVIPASDKAETILLGQYFSPDESAQILRPDEVMNSLMKRILMVRSYIVAAIALISLVTLLTMSLVIVLSIRLRRSELATMSKIGCSRHKIVSILGSQIAIILVVSLILATMLSAATNLCGPDLV